MDDSYATDSQSLRVTNQLLTDARAQLADARNEIVELHDICESKDAIIRALNAEAIELRNELRSVTGAIALVEYNIREYRNAQRARCDAQVAALADELAGEQSAGPQRDPATVKYDRDLGA